MKLQTVLNRRRGNTSAARLRRVLAAAVTCDDEIVLAFITKVVPCKDIGLTHNQCFVAPEHGLSRIIAEKAGESGVDMNDCRTYFRK